MRPNDDFLEQILALDNENQRRIVSKETPLVDTLPKLRDLPNLPKPWHYEFWKSIPGPSEVPFKLRHLHEKLNDDLDKSIALVNPACLNYHLHTTEKADRIEKTVSKSFSFFSLAQMELASSNPFKLSSSMYVKPCRRSPSVSEESSWEYYSDSESEAEL